VPSHASGCQRHIPLASLGTLGPRGVIAGNVPLDQPPVDRDPERLDARAEPIYHAGAVGVSLQFPLVSDRRKNGGEWLLIAARWGGCEGSSAQHAPCDGIRVCSIGSDVTTFLLALSAPAGGLKGKGGDGPVGGALGCGVAEIGGTEIV
jgi:hypothetical protein